LASKNSIRQGRKLKYIKDFPWKHNGIKLRKRKERDGNLKTRQKKNDKGKERKWVVLLRNLSQAWKFATISNHEHQRSLLTVCLSSDSRALIVPL
jgi:hypothetical protein